LEESDKMKKIIYILTSLIMLIAFTSCDEDEEYKTPDQLAKERQTEIMECFINKDKETLKGFFSEYVINKYPDIDSQIDEAFNFLDGEIVSYDEPNSRASGPADKKSYGASTLKIITNKGTEYEIGFKGLLTNEKEADKIGVSLIGVHNTSLKNQNEDNSDVIVKADIYIGASTE